jgi:hypothetical protein
MIQVLENDLGYVYAYIIYQVVDKEGQFKEGGEYLYIQDLWIHERHRSTSFNPSIEELKELIGKVDKDPLIKNTKYVYWTNFKHGERLTRSYIRQRLAKLGE